jgi:PAS domain S-box-containing protein
MVFGIPAVTDNSAEVVVRSETGYDVIARMNLTEEVWEGEEGYIATLRDITQLQKAEKRKEQLNNLLEAVRKINQLIIHEAEGDNLFKKAAEALLELRAYQGITIGLLEEESALLKPFVVAGNHYFPNNWSVDSGGKGEAPQCLKEVLKKKAPRVINDDELCVGCPKKKLLGQAINEVALFPLLAKHQVLGILAVTLNQGQSMTHDEMTLLEDVSGDLAFALDKYRMKGQLEHTRLKYQELFDRSPVGIFQTSSIGQVIAVNTEMARILGYRTVEEVMANYGNLKNDLYYRPERREEFTSLLTKQGKMNGFEYEALAAGGKIIWLKMDATIAKQYDDGTFLIDGFATDITETKRVQQELAVNEKKFRGLFESSRDAVLIANTQRKITDCNPATNDLFGYSHEELTGQKTRVLYKDDKEFEMMGKAITQSNHSHSFYQTVQYRKKSGELFPGETNVFYLYDEAGKVKAVVGLIRDITDRVKAYEKLETSIEEYQQLNEEYQAQNEEYEAQNEELNANLLHIKEINKQLKEAKQKAEENDRLKSAFLANMSHEIRTPMNAIIGFSDLIVSEELDKEEQHKYLKVILQKGDLLLRLINTLIDTAKIEGRQLKLIPEKFAVNAVMDEIYDTNTMLLSRESTKKAIDFRMKKAFPNEPVILSMDVGRLKQILNNLVSNAMKYTYEGFIEVGYTIYNKQITFYVADSGAGIPADEQPHVFERFRRGQWQQNPHTKQLIGGTGIGLSIVKDLAELMNGTITFESAINKGSTFYVRFPFEQKTEGVVSEEKSSGNKHISLKGKRVMVVEDEPDNMEYIKLLLRDTGAELVLVDNGQKAVDLVKEGSTFDLVLMDIKLPGIDGYEATKQIKTFIPSLKVIAQTAWAMAEDEQKAKEAGCDGYVSKPVNKTKMFDTIKKVMM